MKPSTIITYVGVAALASLGVAMAVTNPSRAEYEEYAAQRLTEYAKTNVCKKTPVLLENLINLNCNKLVNSANPRMREIVARNTHSSNFLIFSVYRTDFNFNSWIPSSVVPAYKFETFGAFDNFYTYKAEKQ